MVAATNARNVLIGRVQKAVAKWDELYPGIQAPKACDGFPASEPPFYIAVDSIAASANVTKESTIGAGRWEFTVNVVCFARHTDQLVASETLMAYTDCVMRCVMADQTLDRTVDNAFPSLDAAGTAADTSKRTLAAATVSVRCSVFSVCPKEFKEAVL